MCCCRYKTGWEWAALWRSARDPSCREMGNSLWWCFRERWRRCRLRHAWLRVSVELMRILGSCCGQTKSLKIHWMPVTLLVCFSCDPVNDRRIERLIAYILVWFKLNQFYFARLIQSAHFHGSLYILNLLSSDVFRHLKRAGYISSVHFQKHYEILAYFSHYKLVQFISP